MIRVFKKTYMTFGLISPPNLQLWRPQKQWMFYPRSSKCVSLHSDNQNKQSVEQNSGQQKYNEAIRGMIYYSIESIGKSHTLSTMINVRLCILYIHIVGFKCYARKSICWAPSLIQSHSSKIAPAQGIPRYLRFLGGKPPARKELEDPTATGRSATNIKYLYPLVPGFLEQYGQALRSSS